MYIEADGQNDMVKSTKIVLLGYKKHEGYKQMLDHYFKNTPLPLCDVGYNKNDTKFQ